MCQGLQRMVQVSQRAWLRTVAEAHLKQVKRILGLQES
jgi:hypothetical protein